MHKHHIMTIGCKFPKQIAYSGFTFQITCNHLVQFCHTFSTTIVYRLLLFFAASQLFAIEKCPSSFINVESTNTLVKLTYTCVLEKI